MKSIWLLVILTTFASLSQEQILYRAEQNITRNVVALTLYQAVINRKLTQNVVISPAAVQASMDLAYYGAKGKTATELKYGLALDSNDPEDVVHCFSEFQQNFTRDYIRLSNQIYINENLEFKGKFKEVAQRYFDSNIEKADLRPPYNKRTAERINRVVEKKTDGKVTDIVESDQIDDFIEAIIVNGVSFSGRWQKAFLANKTTKRDFYHEYYRRSYKVDTMWSLNDYKYCEYCSLGGAAVELPYQNADYSMFVFCQIVPHARTGSFIT